MTSELPCPPTPWPVQFGKLAVNAFPFPLYCPLRLAKLQLQDRQPRVTDIPHLRRISFPSPHLQHFLVEVLKSQLLPPSGSPTRSLLPVHPLTKFLALLAFLLGYFFLCLVTVTVISLVMFSLCLSNAFAQFGLSGYEVGFGKLSEMKNQRFTWSVLFQSSREFCKTLSVLHLAFLVGKATQYDNL